LLTSLNADECVKSFELARRREPVQGSIVVKISLRGSVPIPVCPLNRWGNGIQPVASTGEIVEYFRASAWRNSKDRAETGGPTT
jgi:hypothetical protein